MPTNNRGEKYRVPIAKLKFWFGSDIPDLFNSKYIVKVDEDKQFVHIYVKGGQ